MENLVAPSSKRESGFARPLSGLALDLTVQGMNGFPRRSVQISSGQGEIRLRESAGPVRGSAEFRNRRRHRTRQHWRRVDDPSRRLPDAGYLAAQNEKGDSADGRVYARLRLC